ncbi:unnamed protein product [Camellia sinensis]
MFYHLKYHSTAGFVVQILEARDLSERFYHLKNYELLAKEGFERAKNTSQRQVRFRDRSVALPPDEPSNIALPIYICHDRKSYDKYWKQKDPPKKSILRKGSSTSSVLSSKRASTCADSTRLSNSISMSIREEEGEDRGGSGGGGALSPPIVKRSEEEPAIDEVAIRAVVSILSGYIGRYLKDESFRQSIRQKCYYSCLTRRRRRSDDDDKDYSDNGIFANMELGIESIEKLVETSTTSPAPAKQELRMKSLRNSIRLLSIVASLNNSKTSMHGSTCGIPNSYLSACAQLYLSIVYKMEKNDRISARHLLQVFCDSPFLARTELLPELWEHFFLPHLLHLKIWYAKQVEFLTPNSEFDEQKKMEALTKVYNDQMDLGTAQFALYYKEWLKIGSQPPPVPSVPLPSSIYSTSMRRRSSDSFSSRESSINKSNLYRAVFGPTRLERRSMVLDDHRNHAFMINKWDSEEEEKAFTHEDNVKQHQRNMGHRRSSSQIYRNQKAEVWPETQKQDYFRFFTCQSEPTECMVRGSHQQGSISTSNDSMRTTKNTTHLPPTDLRRAINTISSSDSLSDCEVAIRVITKNWLDFHGDPAIEKTLSKPPVIGGMLEVLFSSNDDEILELTVSVLAEFVMRNEANRHIILNSDPQLDIFIRLLRNSSLFLKASVLLYLVKPKAKQMISIEWIPLVLRVLEFGDVLQTLLSVQCSPQVTAYYFLDQLLTGFDEDKNLENARQVVSIGGLSLLVKRIETGDVCEKTRAASVIFCCIRADGSCRHYLANNLNKSCILELLVLGKHWNSQGHAFALLTELLCLNRVLSWNYCRRTQATRFLKGLLSGWGSLNTMHILFVYLQRAQVEERPMVAAILLLLDLLGDPLKCSVYRQEVVEAIIAALDCEMCNERVQEQSAKALLILGGRFSYTGDATTEKWLLKEAGFDDSSSDSFQGKDIVIAELIHSNEEDDAMQNWQRKAAIALLTSGNKGLLAALSDSIANGIPCLARASLVTVSWMSGYLHLICDENLQSEVCSILVPHLIESLNYDKALEERVLASLTLLTLTKTSDECLSKFSLTDKGLMDHLRNLSQVTWTARELISIITSIGVLS